MSIPTVILISVLVIWGTKLISEWIALRERRLEADPRKCLTCIASQNLVVIAAKPVTSDHTLVFNQTVVLKRCPDCGTHFNFVHPGQWCTDDFMKTRSDIEWFDREVGGKR